MNHLVIRWDQENLNEYIAHLLEEVTWKETSGKEGKLGKQVSIALRRIGERVDK